MSRAIQIKHTSEILGVKFKVNDDDIKRSIWEIVSELELLLRHASRLTRGTEVYEFRHCVPTGEDDGGGYNKINYVYFEYHMVENVLLYTNYFLIRLRGEGFKFKHGKLHTLLGEVFGEYFDRRIGVIRLHQKSNRFPVV